MKAITYDQWCSGRKQLKAMTATKLFPSGAWQISAVINGYLVTRPYYGYTEREAIAQFRKEHRK